MSSLFCSIRIHISTSHMLPLFPVPLLYQLLYVSKCNVVYINRCVPYFSPQSLPLVTNSLLFLLSPAYQQGFPLLRHLFLQLPSVIVFLPFLYLLQPRRNNSPSNDYRSAYFHRIPHQNGSKPRKHAPIQQGKRSKQDNNFKIIKKGHPSLQPYTGIKICNRTQMVEFDKGYY